MNWIQKHGDMLTVLAVIGAVFVWMDGKFDKVDDKFESVHCQFVSLEKDLSEIRHELAIMKTVLIMKQILPNELAKESPENGK